MTAPASSRDAGSPAGSTTIADRIRGCWYGMAAGTDLGHTTQFLTPDEVHTRLGRITELTGGGSAGWRPGEPGEELALAQATARTYLAGFSRPAAAAGYLAWFHAGPREVDTVTRAALAAAEFFGEPSAGSLTARRVTANSDLATSIGTLSRAIVAALAHTDRRRWLVDVVTLTTLTHADTEFVLTAAVIAHVAAALLAGEPARAAVADLVHRPGSRLPHRVRELVTSSAGAHLHDLDPAGDVWTVLAHALWVVQQDAPAEQLLGDVVHRGGLAPSNGAICGALLGIRDGAGAIPTRWVPASTRVDLDDLAAGLTRIRTAPGTPRPRDAHHDAAALTSGGVR